MMARHTNGCLLQVNKGMHTIKIYQDTSRHTMQSGLAMPQIICYPGFPYLRKELMIFKALRLGIIITSRD